MKVLFDNVEFDGQLLRALDTTYHGGSDIGECLTTARTITEGDAESWYHAWSATADRINATADASRADPRQRRAGVRFNGGDPYGFRRGIHG